MFPSQEDEVENEEDVLFLDPDSDEPTIVRPPTNTDFGCLFAVVGGLIVGIIYLWCQNH